MSRAGFTYTLWRTKPWWQGGDTVALVEGAHVYLDLQDENATLEQVVDLITRSGGREADIGRYAVDVADLVTGDLVTRLAFTAGDLAAARARRAGLPWPNDAGSPLGGVSDKELLMELARRLTQRR
jgi:hypothetical protein